MLSESSVRQGARVTILYLLIFVATIIYQAIAKTKAIQQGHASELKNKDTKFNRYASNDSVLIGADRAVGNFLEWTPVFLSLFWLALYFGGERTVIVGHAYSVCRVLYLIIVSQGGITRYGPRQTIFFATIPMYGILLYFLTLIVPAIF